MLFSASCGTLAAGLLLAASPAPSDAASTSVPNISGNWAGYVAAPGSGVTSVSGSWTVPNAGTLPPGASATWVGIGGFGTSDLIQTGTQQISAPLNQLISGGAYSAWYELLPASPVTVGGPVSPGDRMTASVVSDGGTTWTVSIADATANWSFSKTLSYQSSESSAEWIHEAPTLIAVPIPVGNSGRVTLDNGGAVINGASQSIAGAGATSVVALPVETAVSSLDSDGNGFDVCTYALSCSPSAS